MNNILKTLGIFIIFLVSVFDTNAFADPSTDPSSSQPIEEITIEEATVDLTSRFVLSTMGPSALQVFVSKEITDLDQPDYSNYTKPFPYIYHKSKYFFSFSAFIALIVAIAYLTYIVSDGIFKSQRSGQFLGSRWNKVFILIKVLVAFVLVMPLNINLSGGQNGEYMSGAQFVVIKLFGYSNEAGKSINETFQRSQPRMFPNMPMPPNSYVLRDVAADIIDFLECKSVEDDSNTGIFSTHYSKGEGLITILVSTANCDLKVKFSADKEARDVINNK